MSNLLFACTLFINYLLGASADEPPSRLLFSHAPAVGPTNVAIVADEPPTRLLFSRAPAVDPTHVAIVTDCSLHLTYTLPFANSLLRNSSVRNKYRVTYVTGKLCRHGPKEMGAVFQGSGLWHYPNLDRDIGWIQFYTNLTRGSISYSAKGLERLVAIDKPDVIIASFLCVGAATVAEKYDIPYASLWIHGSPHFAMWPHYPVLQTSNPETILTRMVSKLPNWVNRWKVLLKYSSHVVLSKFISFMSAKELKTMRSQIGLPMFDSSLHVFNYYPMITMIGEPLLQMKDSSPNFYVTGLLEPPPANFSKLSPKLIEFIEESLQPILYIAMGEDFEFSSKQFLVVRAALEMQQHFNVIWAYKKWDSNDSPKVDTKKLFIRRQVPQREVLAHNKVKVFMTHCSITSLVEALSSEVAILTTPQGRDQFLIADNVVTSQIGLSLGQNPTNHVLLSAFESMFNDLDSYLFRVHNMRGQLSEGSVEKLESILDSLTAKSHITTFDWSKSNVLSFPKACFYIFSTIFLVLSLLVLTAVALYYGVLALIQKFSPPVKPKRKTQ